MSPVDLGARIAEVRRQKGYSQECLAELCQMNVRSIQRIEAGQVRARGFTLQTLSKALDYDFCAEIEIRPNLLQQVKSKIKALWSKRGDKIMNRNVLQRLARSEQDKKIAGICGGLGEQTSAPAWFWRVLFIVILPVYAMGAIAYILLWIFMPKSNEEIRVPQKTDSGWLRQLARSNTDKKIGGVCGGLGEHTSVPSWCWRVLFLLAVVFYGLGIGIYILLWLFMPRAEATGHSVMLATE